MVIYLPVKIRGSSREDKVQRVLGPDKSGALDPEGNRQGDFDTHGLKKLRKILFLINSETEWLGQEVRDWTSRPFYTVHGVLRFLAHRPSTHAVNWVC